MLSKAMDLLRGRARVNDAPQSERPIAPSLKKYVIIRYNVKMKITPQTENGWLNLDPEWLATRHELFCRYCLPSLESQQDRNFTTIMIFDKRTPKPTLEALRDACKNIRTEFIFIDKKTMQDAVRSFIDGDRKGAFVATTRLDSDDVLAPTFMALVSQHASTFMLTPLAEKPVCLAFSMGQQYIVDTGEYRRYVYHRNAFCTLIEAPNGPVQTVLSRQHPEMSLTYDTIMMNTLSAQWCIIVHGGNMKNDARGEVISDPDFLLPTPIRQQ